MNNLPLMSVVIVSHNNVSTIKDAINSVLDQTYSNIEVLIVDDCSDDGTRDVLDELEHEYPYLRILSTLVNSGSAGAPRNLAISSAQGDYISFLDGDDVLDSNAMYNFASNVASYDVDIVSGHMIRRQVANNTEAGWHKWLFKEARTLGTANEYPDLVYDSTSTNKAYRLSFLKKCELLFPEGVYFEDNQFSARAYAKADGIRIIPDTVYYWLVYPAEQRLTITADWKNTTSYADRVKAFFVGYHAFGESHQFDIQNKLVEKTVKHDIWLFIDSAFSASAYSTLVKLWAYAQPVLQTVDTEILANVPLRQRAKIATLIAGDLEAHNEARALSSEPSKLKGSIQDDLWVPSNWTRERSASHELAPYLSVVGDPVGELRMNSTQWRHEVGSIHATSDSVTLEGETFDRLGRFDKNQPLEVLIRVQRNGGNTIQPVPGEFRGWTGPRANWAININGVEDQSWLRGTSWTLDLVIAQGEIVVVGPLKSKKKVQPQTFVPRGAGLLSAIRDQLSILTGTGGELILRRRSRPSVLGVPGKVLSTIERTKGDIVERTLGRLSPARQVQVVGRVCRRMPLKKDLVVFESHMGKQYSDSPRAISESLRATNPGLKQVWSFDNSRFENGYKGDAVVRHSLDYVSALSRAAVVVDNQGFPSYYKRRPGQLYFQTWHGTPMKAMGADAPAKNTRELLADKLSVSNWSVTVCPTSYYNERLIKPMGFSGETIELGLPRNDILVDGRPRTDFEYRELGLRPGYRYILWAPTFREKGAAGIDKSIDLKALSAQMPKDVILLLRAHYLSKLSVPSQLQARVKDVSDVQDISRLYRVADLLVTDYSSVIFDFMLTNKPVVIYAPDYHDYRGRQRGLNIDIERESPGPFVTDFEDLGATIIGGLNSGPGDEYCKFKRIYSGSGDKDASLKAATYISDWTNSGK